MYKRQRQDSTNNPKKFLNAKQWLSHFFPNYKDIIEFEVGKMEFGGVSRSTYEDKRIKMKGGITGQKVRAVVKKSRSDSGEVKLLELLEPSEIETAPVCRHFRQCGGCSILSIPYEKQLEIKKDQILDLFDKAGIKDYEFLGIQGSPSQYAYSCLLYTSPSPRD